MVRQADIMALRSRALHLTLSQQQQSSSEQRWLGRRLRNPPQYRQLPALTVLQLQGLLTSPTGLSLQLAKRWAATRAQVDLNEVRLNAKQVQRVRDEFDTIAHSAIRIDDSKPKVIVTATCGIEPGRIIPYMPLLNGAIDQAKHKPSACIVLERAQVKAELKPGQSLALGRPEGVYMLTVIKTEDAPVLLGRATPAIQAVLTSQRRQASVREGMTRLREQAIEREIIFLRDARLHVRLVRRQQNRIHVPPRRRLRLIFRDERELGAARCQLDPRVVSFPNRVLHLAPVPADLALQTLAKRPHLQVLACPVSAVELRLPALLDA